MHVVADAVTSIFAIIALIFGKYLSKFDVTEKAVVKQVGGKKVTRA